jgi:hypothetical protein
MSPYLLHRPFSGPAGAPAKRAREECLERTSGELAIAWLAWLRMLFWTR